MIVVGLIRFAGSTRPHSPLAARNQREILPGKSVFGRAVQAGNSIGSGMVHGSSQLARPRARETRGGARVPSIRAVPRDSP